MVERDIRIPSLHSFGTLSEEKNDVEYFWDKGTLVSNKEIICQASLIL